MFHLLFRTYWRHLPESLSCHSVFQSVPAVRAVIRHREKGVASRSYTALRPLTSDEVMVRVPPGDVTR